MKTKLTLIAISAFFLVNCDGNQEPIENTDTTSDTSTTAVSETLAEPEVVDNESQVLYGIDISKYQGDEVDYLSFNEDSLTFVICKATEGNTYVDPNFSSNWSTIMDKGYVAGAYHFYRSNDDPTTQANFFLSTVPETTDEHFPLIIDVEGGGISSSSSVEQVEKDVLTFLKVLEDARGRTPIVYTNHSTGSKYLNSADFSTYPLWIADYSGNEEPTLPEVWAESGWTLWQQTDSYEVNGKGNDFDIHDGSRAELDAFLKGH